MTSRSLLLILVTSSAGCSIAPLDLSGFRCGAGACAEGWVCNPVSDICVEEISVDCVGAGTCPSRVATGDSRPIEYFNNNGEAALDNVELVGEVIIPPVTDLGGGAYTTTIALSTAAILDVTCVWDNGFDTPLADIGSVEFQ